jgi:MFS family permease
MTFTPRPHTSFARLALPARAGLPRSIWLLVAGRTLNRLGAFTLPFLTLALTDDVGLSVTLAGVLLSLFGLATIPSRLLGGWLAERIGHRRTIVTGLTTTGAAQIAIAGVAGPVSAALAVTALGLAFELYEPPSQALVADLVEEAHRPAAYSLLAGGMAAAGVLAGLLAAVLGAVDLDLLFLADAVSCLGCAVLLGRALPRDTATGDGTTGDAAAGDGAPQHVAGVMDAGMAWRSPWADPRLLLLLAIGTVFAAIYLQLNATLALTMTARGVEASAVGVLFTVAALTIVVGQPLLGRGPLARLDDWSALRAGYLLLAIGLLGNGFASSFAGFVASAVVWSLGDLMLLGRMYAVVARLAPAGARATYFSVYGLCWGLAAAVGPLAGTTLLALGGPVVLWSVAACVSVLLALVQPVVERRVDASR